MMRTMKSPVLERPQGPFEIHVRKPKSTLGEGSVCFFLNFNLVLLKRKCQKNACVVTNTGSYYSGSKGIVGLHSSHHTSGRVRFKAGAGYMQVQHKIRLLKSSFMVQRLLSAS